MGSLRPPETRKRLLDVCVRTALQTTGMTETTPDPDECTAVEMESKLFGHHDMADLEMLVDVRNEIVHYLPRPTPTLIERLEARGLLMSTPRAPGALAGAELLPLL